ncbi:lysosomal alpha-glucosidase, partial [Thraustotheca clavata]
MNKLFGCGLVAFASFAVADKTSGCNSIPSPRIDCYPSVNHFPNATQDTCLAQGCCWDPNDPVPCAFGGLTRPSTSACSAVSKSSRMACRNPRYFVYPNSSSMCEKMGCCFDSSSLECFQPRFTGYTLEPTSWVESSEGIQARLLLPNNLRGPFGNDIRELQLNVFTFEDQVRVRITDPAFPRYEVPTKLHLPAASTNRSYDVHMTASPFGIAITRKATGETLFNSTPTDELNGLIFENQFIEISTSTASKVNFYGLGEHVGTFLAPTDGDHFTMWARDQVANSLHTHTRLGSDNVYGIHPFYVRREASKMTHGVFFLSSNAIEAIAQNQSLTFRTVGGVLDFFVFLGPQPKQVVEQYTALVGRPALPPYWTMGYHLCRWQNLKNPNPELHLVDVVATLKKMRAHGVPHDGQWTDINAMDGKRDFTWDPVGFPLSDVAAFVDDLHQHKQHYVPIVDAGISIECDDYESYKDGVEMNVFVKDPSNKNIEQDKAWPGLVAFPDFFHPNASTYWKKQLSRYYTTAKYDGIWLDMNEPSSFCTEGGRESLSCSANDVFPRSQFIPSADIMAPFDPYRQPYVPGQKVLATGNLAFKTASLGAHSYNSIQYNVHSLYGHSNNMATRDVVDSIRGSRTFILTRSTFAGDGQYVAHWLGDNAATWTDMHQSIAGVLNSNLFAMPMVGPDVCGFRQNTTKELCIRWHQTAILFPFMRNHNEAVKDQAPVDFDDEATEIIKQTLLKRYTLLPFMYTQLYQAAHHGKMVVQSLYFEFPGDEETLAIDTQYIVGSALMVTPVLKESTTSVQAYFPNASWFNLWTGELLADSAKWVNINAPLDSVPIHIKG